MSNTEGKGVLVGQDIAIYLDGGWSVSGTVKRADPDKIFIENNDEFYMVYRSKISAVCLNFDAKKGGSIESGSDSRDESGPSWPGEQVGGSYNNSLSLPVDMLTPEAQNSHEDNDLSIQFGKTESFVRGAGNDS
jgi:sRNA-binding regulator protein Hfq